MKPLAVLAALLIMASSAWAGGQINTRLRAEQCNVAPAAIIDRRGAPWQRLRNFARICPIHAPNGSLALSVLIIRLDWIIASGAVRRWEAGEPPDPLLLDRQGNVIGALPEGFPVDPPGVLEVSFTDWKAGFPHRIALYEAGTSALRPHPLPPLIWDRRTRRYGEATQ